MVCSYPRQDRTVVVALLRSARAHGHHLQLERTNGLVMSYVKIADIYEGEGTFAVSVGEGGEFIAMIDFAFDEINAVTHNYDRKGA